VEMDCSFILYACCIPVKGARRSIICDLRNQNFRFIPNGLYEILSKSKGKSISEIKKSYGGDFDEEIDGYFKFLGDNDFGFWCDEPENFPNIDLHWERPERIVNAIVDIDASSAHDFDKIFMELDDLGCKALELRFFVPVSLLELRRILAGTSLGRLRSIDLVAGWSEEMSPQALKELAKDNPRIQSFIVHSAPESRRIDLEDGVDIRYRQQRITSPDCCGQVHPGYFVTNLATFTEAQKYNTCLNRKISIDAQGEIKNCPSFAKSFGNISATSLHSALANRDFSKLWEINKDQIGICKDCEFRYICIDCRAYISGQNDIYSKPAKCSYDPYTASWKGLSRKAK
jgi:SPASM domain peptide maturase of grasp-with-spasm system